MPKFSREIIAEVLARCDIVEVVGGVLELKPGGSGRFKALCPFHNEKTPSFTVSRDRQQFHCFGCGKGGDAIEFVREHEGLTFMEALRKLADRVGVRLPAPSERDGKEEYQRTQLIELGKFARRFFGEALGNPLKGSLPRQYLKTRGLKAETMKRFGLGYAPDGWSNLLDAARAAGFKDTVLEASGLVKRGDKGGCYDFFRNRLMIPILDISGNVVAFGGRDLGDGTPKYINSPENTVYKKSRVLYGLYEARDAIRRSKRAILVEGYFDLLRCFDDGIENVVAPCGTALTREQADLIHRYANEAVVVFDADEAGIRAALRGVGLLTDAGLSVRAMVLPDGKDPDDYIKAHGGPAFVDLIGGAPDFVTFYVRANEGRTKTIEGRTAVAREIFGILLSVNDELRREEYIKRTAKELGLNEWTCRGEFTKFVRQETSRASRREIPAEPGPRTIGRDDVMFVAALLSSEPLSKKAEEALAGVSVPDSPMGEILRTLLDTGAGPEFSRRLATDEGRRLYAAAANTADLEAEDAEDVVTQRVVRIRKDSLVAEAARIQEELQEAERSRNNERVLQLLTAKTDIARQIDSLNAA